MIQNRFKELLARKERVERRKITRRQIAAETGISLSSVQNWASNSVKRFDASHITTFCKYFGCGIGELLILVEDDDTEAIEETLLATA